MSTFLIETSEEDTTTAVARLVAEYLDGGKEKTALAETAGSAFLQTCSGLLAENRSAELLDHFLKHLDLICKNAAGSDLECILLVICNLVPKVPAEQQKAAVGKAASALIASSETDKHAALVGLVELYNVTFDQAARFAVLIEVIKFARESGLQAEVGPVVRGKAGDWATQWSLSKEDTRTLFIEVAALLKTLKAKATDQESFELRMKCLATYEDAGAAELAAVRSVAAETAADFVQDPDMFKCDLFSMAAFNQLEADPEHVAVFQLLNIMLAGDLEGLAVFGKEHASALAACNVTAEEAALKTRLMALLALSKTSSPTTTLTFDQVRSALGIKEDEVEEWVVMAIGKNLIEARIDQLERTILVTRCVQRTFDAPQWQALRQQLATWTTNLTAVAEMVASSQVDPALVA